MRRTFVTVTLLGERGQLEVFDATAAQLGDLFTSLPPVDLWEAWMRLGKWLSEDATLDDERRVIARGPFDAMTKLAREGRWR